jgi:shikimate dehydrogenase
MDRYAVLGQPVAHSLSPRIHALFAEQTGAALEYLAIETAPDALAGTLSRLHDEAYAGLNLTLPHKIAAVARCESLSERAQMAGSVNTLVRTNSGWQGDNTDGAGLVSDLQKNLGLDLAGKRILLLGAGGAARGVLRPLLDEAPAELVIAGRTPWKPEALAAEFKSFKTIRPCTFLALKGDRFDLVINATSAGHSGAVPALPPLLFKPNAVAYDLSYGKAAVPFLARAEALGAARTFDGLGMLVEQAAEAFALWRGVKPETASVLAALRA